MVYFYLFYFVLASTCIDISHGNNFNELYKQGVEAYLENRWGDCVAYISSSLESYFQMRVSIVSCKRKCKSKVSEKLVFKYAGDLDNIEFYESLSKEVYCWKKCMHHELNAYTDVDKIPYDVFKDFEKRQPYDYLQICFYKLGDVQNAANYAYSFLLNDPNSTVMFDNLKYYLTTTDVKDTDLTNLEARTYQILFDEGEQEYENENFIRVFKLMKKAIALYFEEIEDCRYLCEYLVEKNHDDKNFAVLIHDHYLETLDCKQKCQNKLQIFNNINHRNFLSDMYNYIQFSSYQLKNYQETCRAVANYLLLLPDHEVMMKNKNFYMKNKICTKKEFVPDKDLVKLTKRNKREQSLLQELKFIKEFDPYLIREVDEDFEEKKPFIPSPLLTKWSKKEGIKLQMGDVGLNGSMRFLADGFSSQEQCSQLIDLSNTVSIEGDGYKGKSPHTKYEKFLGLGVDRLIILLKEKVITSYQAKLFLDLSEKARIYVEKYFNLDNLYFDFTHLVCRTSLKGTDRKDLSHGVHSDNCIIQPDGSCLKDHPAFTWRDYSAILYLNDDFQGGNFFFSDKKFKPQANVSPRCGRVVGFSSENWHGVNAVLKGQRCCLAMWYTLDPNHNEAARSELYNLIEMSSHREL